MRPFCRATTTRFGVDVTCHRMLGHAGPHVCRYRQVDDGRTDVEWFDTVAYERPKVVTR